MTTFTDLNIFIAGQNIPVTKAQYSYDRDTELVYTNQSANPVGLSKGKRNFEGEIELLARDAFRLEASAPKVGGQRYIDELTFDMTKTIQTEAGFVTKVFKDCTITKFEVSGAEGDMNIKVSLPFKFTAILDI